MSNALTARRGELTRTLEGKVQEFAKALPHRIDPERFVRVALTAIVHDEKLMRCSTESLYLALLDSARTGLMPDGTEAAIIPYGNTAEFQEMWQGIARLMMRHGNARKVEARVVKDGDDFDYGYGLTPYLDHKPAATDGRGETTYAYAIAWLDNGETVFDVIDRDELDRIQAQAEKKKPSPAWQNYPDEMRRKTVVKRLGKYLDLAPEAQAAIDFDHAQGFGTVVGETRARARTRTLAEETLEANADAQGRALERRLAEAESEVEPDPDDDLDDLPWKALGDDWEIAHRGAGRYLMRKAGGGLVNSPEDLWTEAKCQEEAARLSEDEDESTDELRERLDALREDLGWSWADLGEKAQEILDLDEPKAYVEFTRGELTVLIASLEPVNGGD